MGGGAWGGWQPLGGYLTSAPDAASWASNRLDVPVLGSDQGLWHLTWNGSSWSNWQGLSGKWTGNPSAVSPPQTAYTDYFLRGTDGHLYWNTQAMR